MKGAYKSSGLKIFYKSRSIIFCTLILLLLVTSCKKYLDQPPSKSLVIPKSLADLQAMTENIVTLASPLSEILADNYYVTSNSWQSVSSFSASVPNYAANVRNEAQHYIWNGTAISSDYCWSAWQPIYLYNVVLSILPDITITDANMDEWNRIKGQALFKRSLGFWHLAQDYCKPYSNTASTDLGLPLRLNADFDEQSVRLSVQQTYDQIINDLKLAADLLPEAKQINPTRPNKTAVYAALARVYLSMRDYSNAAKYADFTLKGSSALMDFNSLNPTAATPMPLFNIEVLSHDETGFVGTILSPTYCLIDTALYQSYDINDLRKVIYFKPVTGGYIFQGNYARYANGVSAGMITDEVYLIRAECFARSGNKDSALFYLNSLIRTRWKNNGSWAPFTATDAADALNKILIERRKELVFRNIRWSDLRRFNMEGANITLKRVISGNTYTLPPNDLKWVALIPQDVINYSGMPQNPR